MERVIKVTEAQRRHVLKLLEMERNQLNKMIARPEEWDLNIQLKRLFEEEL